MRSFDEVPLEKGEVSDAELALARQFIEQAASEAFDPGRYRDEVKERVQSLIDRKIEGEQITMAPQEEPETRIIDLMEALKASLGTAGAERGKTRAVAGGGGLRVIPGCSRAGFNALVRERAIHGSAPPPTPAPRRPTPAWHRAVAGPGPAWIIRPPPVVSSRVPMKKAVSSHCELLLLILTP